MDIDIIIPVYKPDKSLFTLVEQLEKQTVPIQSIVLMNTEEKYFEQLVYGTRFLEQHRKVKVYHLSKREFDHGKTRHMGVQRTAGEVFVMMTQDAMPAAANLVEQLTKALEDNVAVAYARQLPAQDCRPVERYMRHFNYPEESVVKTKEDISRLGIKTYFCSNVCAAYRRDVYEELGGFIRHTIFNEDMIYAAKAIQAGYGVAYAAQAKVIHSHNYTNAQQFHRNFDLGVSQADHPEVFEGLPSETEGRKMVSAVVQYLRKNHMAVRIPGFFLQSACKYAGYFLGKNYRRLPQKWVIALSMNKEYWERESRRSAVAKIDAARGYGRTEEEKRMKEEPIKKIQKEDPEKLQKEKNE